ncbi:unnamed protein product [Aphanomyces euteiches]
MLYGLHITGDRNAQICDNQAAIGLITKARDLKRKALMPKYRDPHRVELRSFMRLLTPEGSFRGLWVRSHQEHTRTEDPLLHQQRQALARADALAATAHTATLPQTYASLLQRDAWELRDHHGLPIFGNTGRWLNRIHQQRSWAARQALSGNLARHTMVEDRTSTPKLCRWTTHETRFFWKATTYTLHTNARKIVSTVIGLRHAAAVTLMLMTPKNTDSALQHPHAQQLSTYNWPDNSPRTRCPIKTSTFPSNASLWPHPRLTFPAEPRGNMTQHEQPPHHTKAH